MTGTRGASSCGRGRGRGRGGGGAAKPAKPSQLPPPLQTRAGNRNTHPGAIAAPTARRSSQAVQEERTLKDQEKEERRLQQVAAIANVAALEDQMAAEDEQYNASTDRPFSRPELPPRVLRPRPVPPGPASDQDMEAEGQIPVVSCTVITHLPFQAVQEDSDIVEDLDQWVNENLQSQIDDSDEDGSGDYAATRGDEYDPESEEDTRRSVDADVQRVSQVSRTRQPVKPGRQSVMAERASMGKTEKLDGS